MLNALLETFSCVDTEIMSNIISFFQKLIKGRVGIRAGGLENFSKTIKRGGTIIRYSRVMCLPQSDDFQHALARAFVLAG